MSRIDQALRRATDAPAAKQPADPFTLDEYPRERLVTPDVGARSSSAATKTPQANAAPAPRPYPLRTPGTGLAARTAEPDLPIDASAGVVQQLRRLAGVVHDRQAERGLKTLALTSAVETQEKTRTAVNLALTLTKQYASRVLLIDANVRPPFVHELIGGHNDFGLSDALRGDRREIPLIQMSNLLQVLPIGCPPLSSAADLTSARMSSLVDECAARYDWVLLDAPEMSLFPGAHVLARLAQGVVFVIGSSTPFPVVERAITELGRECIVGTLLIGLDESSVPPSPPR